MGTENAILIRMCHLIGPKLLHFSYTGVFARTLFGNLTLSPCKFLHIHQDMRFNSAPSVIDRRNRPAVFVKFKSVTLKAFRLKDTKSQGEKKKKHCPRVYSRTGFLGISLQTISPGHRQWPVSASYCQKATFLYLLASSRSFYRLSCPTQHPVLGLPGRFSPGSGQGTKFGVSLR